MNPTMIDTLWLMASSALVFVMQGGFALVESGLTRSKNSINVAIKNLTDLGISILAFWLVGFGLMFGDSWLGWTGTTHFFFRQGSTWMGTFFLFQAMFCSTSATIVSGAVAERMRYSSYLISTVVLSALIYPIIGHWAWGGAMEGQASGFLNSQGFVDFAGSTVVHSLGGWVALAILIIIGPRIGRYNKNGTVNKISGANLPNAVVGVIILWFGWFGFNGGSTFAMNDAVPGIILRTSLAAGAGMIAALLIGWPLFRVPDVNLVINGSLAGLVAITASVHAVSEIDAIVIGSVGGVIMLGASWLLDRLRIDDAVGAIPVHLAAGIWGTLAVGIFGIPEVLGTGLNQTQQILIQLGGIGLIGGFGFGASWIILMLVNLIKPLRVSAEDELTGLNTAEHGATTEIYDLYRTMDNQARTGDLSLRAPVEPFTEVGQIASQYNKVMDNLQSNLVAKSEYLNILTNVNDGLFLLDKGGKISPFYSSALERILESGDLAGQNLRHVLTPRLPTGTMDNIQDFLDVLFDVSIDMRTVNRLNPLTRVDLFFEDKPGSIRSKHVAFTFQRILEERQVVRLMVIVQDITQQVQLAQSMEVTQKERESEMELFYKIIHLDPQLLEEFLKNFEDKLVQMNSVLESGQNVPQEVLKQLYRLAHGIKGEASLLELGFIVESTHRFEDMIEELQKKTPLANSDFIALTFRLGEIQATGRRMSTLLDRLSGFQEHFLKLNLGAATKATHAPKPVTGSWSEQLDRLVQRLADDYGKKMVLKTEGLAQVPRNLAEPVREIAVQLIRNSGVHGIELPEERLAKGKAEWGLISLGAEFTMGGLVVTYRDDGRGLDLEKIREKVVSQGQVKPEVLAKWSKADYIRHLFSEGGSTAEKVTSDAGRGVGMGLVRDLVRRLGGKMSLQYKPEVYTEFRFTFPGSLAT